MVKQLDRTSVLKATESVFIALGYKQGKSWEKYVSELPKMPWTSIYLAFLELYVVHGDNTVHDTTDHLGSNGRISVINKKQ